MRRHTTLSLARPPTSANLARHPFDNGVCPCPVGARPPKLGTRVAQRQGVARLEWVAQLACWDKKQEDRTKKKTASAEAALWKQLRGSYGALGNFVRPEWSEWRGAERASHHPRRRGHMPRQATPRSGVRHIGPIPQHGSVPKMSSSSSSPSVESSDGSVSSSEGAPGAEGACRGDGCERGEAAGQDDRRSAETGLPSEGPGPARPALAVPKQYLSST